MDSVEFLRKLGPALVDAWYVVDAEDRIVEFNSAFHELFPRAVARKLKGQHCRSACNLPPCSGEGCLRQLAGSQGPVRIDEVDARIGNDTLRLIVSAAPVTLPDGSVGAVIFLRNVTAESRIQERYQQSMDEAEQRNRRLRGRLAQRTRELLNANDELTKLEDQVARLRRSGG